MYRAEPDNHPDADKSVLPRLEKSRESAGHTQPNHAFVCQVSSMYRKQADTLRHSTRPTTLENERQWPANAAYRPDKNRTATSGLPPCVHRDACRLSLSVSQPEVQDSQEARTVHISPPNQHKAAPIALKSK